MTQQATWKYVILGIVLVHFKTIVNLVRNPPRFDENIEKAFAVIKAAEKKGIPKYRIRAMYLDVCRGVLANVTLKSAAQREMRELPDATPPSSGTRANRDDNSEASLPPNLGIELPETAPTSTWETDAKACLKQGRKINAIKIVRENTGMDLAAAKHLVESWQK